MDKKDREIAKLKSYLNVALALEPGRCDGKTFTRFTIIADFINRIEDNTLKAVKDYLNKVYPDYIVFDDIDIKVIKKTLEEERI